VCGFWGVVEAECGCALEQPCLILWQICFVEVAVIDSALLDFVEIGGWGGRTSVSNMNAVFTLVSSPFTSCDLFDPAGLRHSCATFVLAFTLLNAPQYKSQASPPKTYTASFP
jgi:hypothetical protein